MSLSPEGPSGTMSTSLTSIKGIGPATAEGFIRAGITSAEELREIGADAAYAAWIEVGNPAHFIGYYALHMALQGRPWNDCKGEEKKALRKRFDAIKATSHDKGRSEFEAALDAIGVIEKR